jgi:hypothetical protein
LFVPFEVVISIKKCLNEETLKPFYLANENLFTKGHRDWEQLVLTVFLMYQK